MKPICASCGKREYVRRGQSNLFRLSTTPYITNLTYAYICTHCMNRALQPLYRAILPPS